MKVIKINAIWCSGCLVMNKVWKKITSKYNILTTELDYDMDENEVQKYNPGKILPVFIVYNDNNEECLRIIGEMKEEEMLQKLKKVGVLYEKDN